MSSETVPIQHRRLVLGSRLPPELIDAIIDHLHDDTETLKVCSLVCKTLTRSARFHLFFELSVIGPNIRQLSESAPDAIPFIRHLRVRDLSLDDRDPLVEFKSIRSLTVDGLHIYTVDGDALSALFQNFSAAVDVRLDEVETDSVGPLIRVICAFPSLQRLAVTCRGIRSDEFGFDLPAPTAFSLSPHLRVLELDRICMDPILDWFLSLPDRPALCALGLRPIRPNNFSTIAKFLQTQEDSLETFLISTTLDDGSHWPFDLRHHTRLRSLQIDVGSVHDDTMLVTQLLSQIHSAEVTEVGLEVYAGEDQNDGIRRLRWNEIDDALQHPSFSGLSKVNIRAIQWPGLHPWNPDDVPWITDHMPKCDARGILHIREMEWEASYFIP